VSCTVYPDLELAIQPRFHELACSHTRWRIV